VLCVGLPEKKFAGLVVLLLLLAGCGGNSKNASTNIASKSPDEIFAAAKAAAFGASSVHVFGSVALANRAPITVDSRFVKGVGAIGHVSLGGTRFDVIRIGANAYLRAPQVFWRAHGGAAAARLFKRNWLKVPVTGSFASLVKVTDFRQLFFANQVNRPKFIKVGTTIIDGQTVVGIKDVNVKDKSYGAIVYVAATGTPYPVESKKSGVTSPGSIIFSQWDQPVALAAPRYEIDRNQLFAWAVRHGCVWGKFPHCPRS
jgi:hypothetical protein